jgi:hypothetical protein
MKVDTESLLPNKNLMAWVAVIFVILAVCFGLVLGEYSAKQPFPLLACVVWGLGFAVIFAIIYVIWLIFHAIRSYKMQAQKQRMKVFQRALDGKPIDN